MFSYRKNNIHKRDIISWMFLVRIAKLTILFQIVATRHTKDHWRDRWRDEPGAANKYPAHPYCLLTPVGYECRVEGALNIKLDLWSGFIVFHLRPTNT